MGFHQPTSNIIFDDPHTQKTPSKKSLHIIKRCAIDVKNYIEAFGAVYWAKTLFKKSKGVATLLRRTRVNKRKKKDNRFVLTGEMIEAQNPRLLRNSYANSQHRFTLKFSKVTSLDILGFPST